MEALRTWRRRAPAEATLRVCGECEARFVRWARDRASDSLDHLRLVGLMLRLGGEVWVEGDRSFWYPEPLHSPVTAWLEPWGPAAPSPYTKFLRVTHRRVKRGLAPDVARAPSAVLGLRRASST